MKNEPTIGELIKEEAKRDAIHVAISPARAAVILHRGQDVGLVSHGFGPSDNNLGIVDPFLRRNVLRGEMFWLFLYPGTITSLRHEWSLPALDPSPTESETWLRNFVTENNCPDYETLVAAACGGTIESINPVYGDPYTIDDEYLHFYGRDAHGDIPDQFWDHIKIVTGRPCHVRPRSFSCSC